MPERNVVAWNAMVAGYVQNGKTRDAYEVFCRMPERNDSSWAAMITGFAQVGKLDEAKRLLDAMPFDSVISQTALISGHIQSGILENVCSSKMSRYCLLEYHDCWICTVRENG